MANLTKRPDGRWRARYRDSAGKEHARHFTRKVDAQSWLDSVTTAVRTGSYVDPGRSKITVSVMAEEWLAGKINLRPSTKARYENSLAVHVLPRWGSVPLDRIEHGDLQRWVADMSNTGLAGATVRKNHGILSSILRFAVREKRIASNPSDGLNLPALNERRRRYLTASQVNDLADAAGPHRLVVLTLAYCGLRWSELAGLHVENVNLMRRRLDISQAVVEIDGARLHWNSPKNHERRTVPIPRFLADELAPHLHRRQPDDLVFTSSMGGVLRNKNARRDWFNAAAAAIGQPGFVPHELRHTAASLAVSAGAIPRPPAARSCASAPAVVMVERSVSTVRPQNNRYARAGSAGRPAPIDGYRTPRRGTGQHAARDWSPRFQGERKAPHGRACRGPLGHQSTSTTASQRHPTAHVW